MLLKKKKNAILVAQLEQYEKIIQEANKDANPMNLVNLINESAIKSPIKSGLKSINGSQHYDDFQNSILNNSKLISYIVISFLLI